MKKFLNLNRNGDDKDDAMNGQAGCLVKSLDLVRSDTVVQTGSLLAKSDDTKGRPNDVVFALKRITKTQKPIKQSCRYGTENVEVLCESCHCWDFYRSGCDLVKGKDCYFGGWVKTLMVQIITGLVDEANKLRLQKLNFAPTLLKTSSALRVWTKPRLRPSL